MSTELKIVDNATCTFCGCVCDDMVLKVQDTQEDLVVAAADGTGMRRITNDRFKDRSSRWGPDSELIYFLSDRTGRYDVWRIHRDGSGLGRLGNVARRRRRL